MKSSQDQWWIKDTESRFIYANDVMLRAANVPKNFDIEGKLDKEIPASCEELYEEFVTHDKKVIDDNKKISAIAISYFGEKNLTIPLPSLQDKEPFYDDKNHIIGTIGHARIIDSPTLLFYIHRLNRKMVQFDAPNDLFTKRELDIIFWAQQRLGSKEISKQLNISSRTVSNILQSIYKKAGVHSIIQLIEYCKHTGLDTYVPADFILNGLKLIE